MPWIIEKALPRTGRAFPASWGLNCDTDIGSTGCLGWGFASVLSWLCDPYHLLTSLRLGFLIC